MSQPRRGRSICQHPLIPPNYSCAALRPTLKKGARLGYMGQLIDIMDVLTTACRIHDSYRALVEDSLDADQLADWFTIAGQSPSNVAVAVEPAVEPTADADTAVAAIVVVVPSVVGGELDAELKLQRTLLVRVFLCGWLVLPYKKIR